MLPFLVFLFFHLFFFSFTLQPTAYLKQVPIGSPNLHPESHHLAFLVETAPSTTYRIGYRLAVPPAALSVKCHLLLWKGGDGWVSCKSQLLHRLKAHHFLALDCRYLPVLVPQAVQAWHPPILLFIQWNQDRVAPNKIRCPVRKQDGWGNELSGKL